jgi:tetratricopeptide (TPR) repeat protein
VKLAVALVSLVVVVAIGVLLIEQASGDRQYARLLRTGQQALDAGKGYAAVEAFTGALTLRPRSMVAYFHRGEAYRAERREDEALRDFRAANRLAPRAPEPLVALGDLFESTDPAQAASWYAEAILLKPSEPELLYKLGLARYRAGAPAEAVAPLTQLVAMNDSAAHAHYLLGLVYRDTQHFDEAEASLERAIKVAPNLIPAREELADLYHSRGRLVDEMSQLQALATLDDLTPRTVNIALAEAGQGQFPAALGSLTSAASRAPSDSQVQLALGRVHLARAERTGDRVAVTRALDALEQALGGTARRSEGLALFGRALWLKGDYEAAERILREAVATSPVDPAAFGYLADASERMSHFAEARDALSTLDVLEGDTASAEKRATRVARLGMLSLRAGDYTAAVNYLARAVAAGKQDAQTLGQLAQARLLTGDRAGAQESIERALALEPRNLELLRVRRQLQNAP